MQAVFLWVGFCFVAASGAVRAAGDQGNPLREAEGRYRAGNYAAAYDLASTAAPAAQELRARAQAEQLLATICYRSGRLREALKHGQDYVQLVDRPGVKDIPAIQHGRQDVAMIMAEAAGLLGRQSTADAWFEYALRIPNGQRTRHPTWEAEVRLRWAATIPKADSAARAPALYRKAAEIAQQVLLQIDERQLGAEHRAAATEAFVQACLATERLHDAQQALQTLLATQQDPRDRVDTLCRLADLGHQTSSDEREIELLEQAVAEGDANHLRFSLQRAQALERLAAANVRQAQRQRAKADSLMQQARRRWRDAAECYEALSKVVPTDERSSFDTVSSLQHLYESYVRLNSWQQARDAADRLLRARQKILLPDDPRLFRARTALGICHAKCDQPIEARKELEAALRFWDQYQPTAFKDLADTLQNLAELERTDGNYDAAQTHLEKASGLLQSSSPDDVGLIECHIALGNVYSAKGEYEAATREYHAAEEACTRREKRNDETRRLHSVVLLGRAAVYKMQLRLDLAIKDCGGALEILRGFGDGQSVDQLPCLTTLATLHLSRYEAQGGPPKSRDFELARSFATQADELGRDRDDLPLDQRCQTLNVLALISFREAQSHLRATDDPDRDAASRACEKAIELWQQAATLGQQLPAVQARSMTYQAEAELLRVAFTLAGPHASAADALETALEIASKAIGLVEDLHVYPGLHYRALLTRAKIHKRQSKIEAAIRDLQEAARIVEAPRSSSLGADKERAMFFSQFVEAYELLVSWLVEQKDYDSAVAYAQISRNRTFIEQVTISQSDQRAELASAGKSELLDELRKQREHCDRLKYEVQQAANRKLSDEARRKLHEKWIKPLADAQRDCDRLELAVRENSDSYRELLRRGLTVDDWEAARKQVVGAAGLLLVYHVGPTASQLFVITPADGVTCHKLEVSSQAAGELAAGAGRAIAPGPVSSDLLRDLVDRYLWRRHLPTSRGSNRSERGELIVDEPLSPAQSVRLAEIVLPKAVRDLIGERKPPFVTVVPDGALHRLPLESLLLDEKSSTYVLDDETIPPLAYAPSAMVMAILQSRDPDRKPVSLLTVGKRQYKGRGELRFAEEESDSWAGRFAKLGAEPLGLLGPAATQRAVRDEIRGKKFVHFAVHADVDTRFDSVRAASLVLSPERAGDDDALLDLQEVYALPLGGCELAVLSACQSNVGPDRNLEAGSTLTRAFLSAGARRVVASLWSVADESTKMLMDEFAKAIAESLDRGDRPDYAHALQRARRHVKQHKDFSDPLFWAPFVLIGPAVQDP